MPGNGKRLRKTIRRTGGGVIGTGTYGCVFRPALRCKGNITRRNGKISKLMRSNQADDEFQQKTLFEPINARQNYFLYPEELCEPELPFEASNMVNDCKSNNNDDVDNTNKLLLLSSDGGQPLSNINFITPNNIYPFFESLTNIFEGLSLAHNAGIAHMDVKPANMVIKAVGPKLLTRLIDFGLSVKIDTVPVLASMKDNKFHDYLLFMTNYPYWSPDLRFANPSYAEDLLKKNKEQQLERLAKDYTDPKVRLSKLVSYTEPQLIDNDYADYFHLMNTGRFSPPFFNPNGQYKLNHEWALDISDKLYDLSLEERLKLIFTKNDVFGLGQSLFVIFSRVLEFLSSDYPVLAYKMTNSFYSSFSFLYVNMTNPDPFQRFDIKAALNFYKNTVLADIAQALRFK